MQYLLIISHGDSFSPTEKLLQGIAAWIEDAQRHGVRVHGNPLRPAGEATTIRVRDAEVAVTRGPFADSREKMCAYELIECASLDEAIDWAARHPMASAATIEVRPVWAELADRRAPD